MLCHIHGVSNKIKFCYEMFSGKELGHIFEFISDDKHAQSN